MSVTLEFQGKSVKLGDTPEQAIQTMTEATEAVKSGKKKESTAIHVDKLKLTDKRQKINLAWTQGNDSYTLESWEKPRHELIELMDGLLDTVIKHCYLDEEFWQTKADSEEAFISGMTLKHDGGIGCVLTAQLKLEDKVVVINTPYLKPEDLWPEEQKLLQDLHKEAIAYINGNRAQLSLFAQDEV